MLKRFVMIACTLGVAFSVQAFDKNQVALDKTFWGNWSVYNAKHNVQKNINLINRVSLTTQRNKKKCQVNLPLCAVKMLKSLIF